MSNEKISKYKIFILGGIILSVLLVIAFLYSEYLTNLYVPTNITDNSPKLITINQGMSIAQLEKTLKENHLISSPFWLKIYLRWNHLDNKLQAGKYKFYSWMSPAEIIKKIIKGETIRDEVKITIPEGFTNKQIDQRLEKKFGHPPVLSNLKVSDFQNKYKFLTMVDKNKSLQGFLFPDTYSYSSHNVQDKEVVDKMLNNFLNQVQGLIPSEISSFSISFYQKLILASIVEKEVRSLKDKKIVAGIFINRLKNGQPLQSCATIAYALGENKKIYSLDDIKVNSPFNTYLHPGLPPEPICNPGLDSIMATLNPTKTDFNYFLTDPKTGKTIFSRNLREHQMNKRKYLKN